MSKIKDYEKQFIQYYRNNYNAVFMKVNHNKGFVPTKVTLYNENKRVIKHQPVYFGVTVRNMFAWLDENKIYTIDDILKKGSE